MNVHASVRNYHVNPFPGCGLSVFASGHMLEMFPTDVAYNENEISNIENGPGERIGRTT